jgi:hypothetical protein
MPAKSTHLIFWSLAVIALTSSGLAALLVPPELKAPSPRDGRPLYDSPLVGCWRGQGDAAQYRLNITPSVLFLTSQDEAEICEIEVLSYEHRSTSGRVKGVIRLDRVDHANLPHAGRQVIVNYTLRHEVLELSWDESPELLSRFANNQLSVVRGSNPEELVTHDNSL